VGASGLGWGARTGDELRCGSLKMLSEQATRATATMLKMMLDAPAPDPQRIGVGCQAVKGGSGSDGDGIYLRQGSLTQVYL
jgi:hypothetical protein